MKLCFLADNAGARDKSSRNIFLNCEKNADYKHSMLAFSVNVLYLTFAEVQLLGN